MPDMVIQGAERSARKRNGARAKETALWLVNPAEYASAERLYDGDPYLIACELGVTMQVVNDYRQILSDSPRSCDGVALHVAR